MKIWSRRKALGRSGKPRRRLRIVLAILALLAPLSVLALWTAIHKTTWLGPLLADTARSIVGPDAVARLEEVAYGVQDRWRRWSRKDDQPEAYWEVPPAPIAPAEAPVASDSPELPPFTLQDVGPVHAAWSAPGDGTWVPVVDERHPNDPPRMLKTLLHPDKVRSWTALSIVAVDLRQVDLHLVAGRYEPKATEQEAAGYERLGRIPDKDHDRLLAAFNGGFKLEHGHYGMRVDDITLVKPRKKMCTVVRDSQESVAIAPWEGFADTDGAKATWWRQTPFCMVEGGELHVGLRDPENTHWGCTLDGQVVIRRSAIGVSKDGKTLYVGIGDDTTARAIALAMKHAGAWAVAQLDVNFSYPKFLLYGPKEQGSTELVARALCKGFEFTEDEYIRARSHRDFFYLARKVQADKTASNDP